MKNFKLFFLIFSIAAVLFTGWGCASSAPEKNTGTRQETAVVSAQNDSKDTADLPPPGGWTISELVYHAGGGEDSCEKFNRPMDTFNSWLMKYLVRPIGYIYGSIIPREGIKRINMAADNLAFPQRMVSCLLQAKWSGAGSELGRFLINTTIGIAGLFDPADYFWQIYRRDEDIGTAFAQWGIPSGAIITLPVLQNGYVRDHIGSIFDMALDIKTYLPYTSTPAGLSRAVEQYRPYIRLSNSSYDRYEMLKEYHIVRRQMQLDEWTLKFRRELDAKKAFYEAEIKRTGKPPKQKKSSDPYVQSLKYLAAAPRLDEDSIWTHLSLWNGDFSSRIEQREIQAVPGGIYWEYGFIPPREKDGEENLNAPLVILIPGLGGYYFNSTMLMLAELISENTDCGVLMLNNSMNWSSLQAHERRLFGGYGPSDLTFMSETLDKILHTLKEKDKYIPEKTIIAGYSMGAISALDLAAAKPDRYKAVIAIHPPVDMIYAMGKLDECRESIAKLPPSEIIPMTIDAFAKSMAVSANPRELIDVVEFTPQQARLMMFLSFGYTLRDLIAVPAERESDNGKQLRQIKTEYESNRRTPYYRAIDKFSFRDYMEEFVTLEYPELTIDDLNRNTSLRRLENFLRSSDRILVIHSRNDFLLSEADREFLDRTLGRKIVWSDDGGHLGNMYTDEFRNKFLNEIKYRLQKSDEPAKSEAENSAVSVGAAENTPKPSAKTSSGTERNTVKKP